MLLPQSQSIAGRLKQQDAVTSVHDQSPPRPPLHPGKPVSYITHLQGTSVAQDPTQVAPPASSRHPLLGTPSPAWATWLALLCFSENPVCAPWRCTTLLAYAIFLAVSCCHQVGGGQRWCFISLCCPSLWAGCGGWWTIFVDHRKQGGRRKTDTIYESGIGVAITEFLTI